MNNLSNVLFVDALESFDQFHKYMNGFLNAPQHLMSLREQTVSVPLIGQTHDRKSAYVYTMCDFQCDSINHLENMRRFQDMRLQTSSLSEILVIGIRKTCK